MKDLEELTFKILKSSSKFTSNDFIKSYNIIYLHCTEKTQTYEIKGREVYETLKKVLINYLKSLRPIASLQSFYDLSQKLEKSFVLLERVYFYLERFFINVNSKKRGSNVVHLRNLFYDLLYKHFMYGCMTNLEEFFIYEIGIIRKDKSDNEKTKVLRLSQSISYIKDIFFYSENEVEYEHFLEIYFDSFTLELDKDDIYSLITKINFELILAKKLFEFSNKESYFPITQGITTKFKDFFDYVLGSKPLTNNNFLKNYKKVDKILYFMDDKYVNKFFIKFEPFILEYIKTLENYEELFMFFKEFKETFNLGNVKSDVLEIKVENEIILKIRNNDKIPNFFCSLIDKYAKNGLECDNTINYVFYLTNLIHQKNTILKKLGQYCLERIINETTRFFYEQKIIKIWENNCGISSVSWLKLILQTYDKPFTQNFGMSGQEFDFEVSLRLITKGFCNLDITSTILHPKLGDLKDILIKRCILKYSRSDIKCCYRASSIIFKLNDIEIKLSTDKVSILMYVSEQSNLEKIKEKCKDPNFKENIDFLVKNAILKIDRENIFINEDTSEILRRVGHNSNKFINLFSYEILSQIKIEDVLENNRLLDTAIECFIMKMIKRLKKSSLEDITLEVNRNFGMKNINLKSFLKSLATKGYLNIINGNIMYIP